MIKAEFGIMNEINPNEDYSDYEPEKYNCTAIDDDYLDDWWDKLSQINTYFHCLNRPEKALARWGVTLIPPESLPAFLFIINQDYRIKSDKALMDLAVKIQKAITTNKFMIHYGV